MYNNSRASPSALSSSPISNRTPAFKFMTFGQFSTKALRLAQWTMPRLRICLQYYIPQLVRWRPSLHGHPDGAYVLPGSEIALILRFRHACYSYAFIVCRWCICTVSTSLYNASSCSRAWVGAYNTRPRHPSRRRITPRPFLVTHTAQTGIPNSISEQNQAAYKHMERVVCRLDQVLRLLGAADRVGARTDSSKGTAGGSHGVVLLGGSRGGAGCCACGR